MPTRLYLDTARLGLMSGSAQQVYIDFVRFAGEEAASLYFEQFLRNGTQEWPAAFRTRFPSLEDWKGVAHLKHGLKTLVGASAWSKVLLANRSAKLLQLAARLLFRPCSNVLVTDLSWPPWLAILERERDKARNRLTRVALQRWILRDAICEDELVALFAQTFVDRRCDGLFLPMVDNRGIRLPVSAIVREIERRAKIRFIVVDGAQAFCHVPVQLAEDHCDLFIAGCHKWLGAFHPMGVAFYGHRSSSRYVETTLRRLINSGHLDDPLLKFCYDNERGRTSGFGETVMLSPLFSCQGAVNDTLQSDQSITGGLYARMRNSRQLAVVAEDAGWNPLAPADCLGSGIALLQARKPCLRAAHPESVRALFDQAGIAVTAYRGGVVRMSMPERLWSDRQLRQITSALETCAASS